MENFDTAALHFCIHERKTLLNSFTHLTVSLGLRPFECTDSITDRNLLQEGVALRLGEIWRLQLAKVELHSAVAADDVGKKGPAVQGVLADLESDSWLASVLGVGQHHLLTFKVLHE